MTTTKHYPVNDADLDALADKLLALDDAGQWSPYTQYDLNNALLVMIRVCGSILFQRYRTGEITFDEAVDTVERLGTSLRNLMVENLKLDPHAILKDLRALKQEQTP